MSRAQRKVPAGDQPVEGRTGRCLECNAASVRRVIPRHEYKEIGIPVILIESAEEERCARGHVSYSVTNVVGLLNAVALARVLNPVKLSGTEVRFLRKALGMKGSDFATTLSIRAETISRWENNKEPIGPSSEKLLRVIVAYRLGGKRGRKPSVLGQIERMQVLSVRQKQPKFCFVREWCEAPRQPRWLWTEVKEES